MDVAVAILATCGNFAGARGQGVNAVRISLPLVGVALGAGDFFRGGIVRETLDVCVAVDALEHGTVNGVLELVGVDGDAVAVARGHAGVAVAGKAVGVLELLRGEWGGGPGKTKKDERKRCKPASKVHALRRRFGENSCRDCSHRGSL